MGQTKTGETGKKNKKHIIMDIACIILTAVLAYMPAKTNMGSTDGPEQWLAATEAVETVGAVGTVETDGSELEGTVGEDMGYQGTAAVVDEIAHLVLWGVGSAAVYELLCLAFLAGSEKCGTEKCGQKDRSGSIRD